MSEWGRIAEDGTVFVRTADGERPIGSWQAGTVEEGLAFYERRYDDLAAEIGILEARIETPTADPKAVAAGARKLRDALPTAGVLGDISGLDARLAGVLEKVDGRLAAHAADRAAAAAQAADRKRALVEEARKLAAGSDWRATGDRFRAIVEEWKTIRGVDRKTDSELWEQLATARKEFDRRRRAHFAELDKQRGESAEHKERLVTEAEKLAGSEDWGPTARRFRDLMTEWKSAGRAAREVDDGLWARFKAAQDTFFTRRSEVFSARDAEYGKNLEAKEALVAEAETLDPSSDLEGARKRLRTIHDKWEKVGKVPRESMAALEARMAAVEQRVREAGQSTRHVVVTESPLVIRLRESVEKLEARLTRARAAGDDKLAAETEESLATQRAWLEQAERSAD
jgi:BMFP domain-containing protein YqiC